MSNPFRVESTDNPFRKKSSGGVVANVTEAVKEYGSALVRRVPEIAEGANTLLAEGADALLPQQERSMSDVALNRKKGSRVGDYFRGAAESARATSRLLTPKEPVTPHGRAAQLGGGLVAGVAPYLMGGPLAGVVMTSADAARPGGGTVNLAANLLPAGPAKDKLTALGADPMTRGLIDQAINAATAGTVGAVARRLNRPAARVVGDIVPETPVVPRETPRLGAGAIVTPAPVNPFREAVNMARESRGTRLAASAGRELPAGESALLGLPRGALIPDAPVVPGEGPAIPLPSGGPPPAPKALPRGAIRMTGPLSPEEQLRRAVTMTREKMATRDPVAHARDLEETALEREGIQTEGGWAGAVRAPDEPLPRNLTRFHEDHLVAERTRLQDLVEADRARAQDVTIDAHEFHSSVYDDRFTDNPVDPIQVPARGASRAKFAINARERAIERIDAELDRRGVDANAIAARQIDDTSFNFGENVDEAGNPRLRNRSGAMNPALLVQPGAATTLGAAVGAASDPDDPVGGAIRGGAVGLLGSIAIRAGTNAMAAHNAAKLAKARGLTGQAAADYATAAAGVDFTGALQRAADKFNRGGWATMARRAIDQLADVQRPLDRLGAAAEKAGLSPAKSPATKLNQALSSDHVIARALRDGVIDPIDRQQTIGPSFESVFAPLGRDPKAVRDASLFAVESRIAGRGVDAVAGDQARYDAAVRNVAEMAKNPANVAFAGRIAAYTEGLGQYAVKSGLWTPEQWAAMQASDALYVPFKRILGNIGEGVFMGAPRRMVNVGSGVQRFHGSNLAIANPAEALAQYTASIIRRADRYRVGASVFDAVEAMGVEGEGILSKIAPPKASEQAMENVRQALAAQGMDPTAAAALADLHVGDVNRNNPVIWRNGPAGKEYATLQSPELLDALAGLKHDDPTSLGRVLRFAKRVTTVVATGVNPKFVFGTQPMIDAIDAVIKTKGVGVGQMLRGYREAGKAALGKSPQADALAREGLSGVSIFAHGEDPSAFARKVAPTTSVHRIVADLRDAALAPLRAAERVGAASDLAPRLAAAEAVGNQATAAGRTPQEVMALSARAGASGTVDFRRTSGIPAIHVIETTVPYFGAAIRASVRFGRAAKEHPGRVGTAAGLVVLGTLLEYASSKNNRTIATDRPNEQRARGWSFERGPGERPFTWVLPQEYRPVAAATRFLLGELDKDDPHAAGVLMQSMLTLLPPVVQGAAADLAGKEPSNPGTVMAGAASDIPVIGPLSELATNRKNFGGRPIEPKRMQDLPASERKYPTTPPTYEALAEGARAIGMEDTSPLQVEHLIRSQLGAFEPIVTALGDPMSGKGSRLRVPRSMLDQSLNPASAFIGKANPTSTESEGEFYRLKERAKQLDKAAQAYVKVNDADGVRRFVADHKADARKLLGPRAAMLFGVVDDQLQEIRAQEEQVKAAFGAGKVDGEKARGLLEKLRTQRQTLYRKAVGILEGRTPLPAMATAP